MGDLALQVLYILYFCVRNRPRVSVGSVIFLIALVYHMRDAFYFRMSMAWWFAWSWFSSVLSIAIPRRMPVGWFIFWVCLICGLIAAIHPDRSPFRLFGMTALIMAIRSPIYAIYLLYFCPGDKSKLFPFNLFAGRWRVSRPRWYPIWSDADDETILCGQCKKFTSGSKLIMGSNYLFARLEEWHALFDSFNALKSSVEGTPRCGLCVLFWYSMSEQKRSEIAKLEVPSRSAQQPESTSPSINAPNTSVKLRVRVWEERPLSQFVCAQLFRGDVAIGARLLVHRGELFAKPSQRSTLLLSSTDSEGHIKQAKSWLDRCAKHHTLCKGVGDAPRKLPTRLVHVSSTDDAPTIKLVETNGMDERTRYLALSHRWGGSPTFTLTVENYLEALDNIDISQLSKNMRDAIKITQLLGFSYIWIDSICIKQNSAEDWLYEAARMGNVYSGAFCTLASTGAFSGDDGCFHERDEQSLLPVKVGISSLDNMTSHGIYIRRDDVFDLERNVDRAPLNKRAWVLQERLLSRRILHFGIDMIYWECCLRSASELLPNGYIYKKYPEDFKDNYFPGLPGIDTRAGLEEAERRGRGLSWATEETVNRRPPPPTFDPDGLLGSYAIWQRERGFWKDVRKPAPGPWQYDEQSDIGFGFRAALRTLAEKGPSCSDVGVLSFSTLWYEIVEPYTRCDLTQAKDKLIAISSIAQEIQRKTHYTYVAGLWKERLLTDLLWFAAEGPGTRPTESESGSPKLIYLAPTWSWASLQGMVGNDLIPDNSLGVINIAKRLATIAEVGISLTENNVHSEFGAVEDGFLDMSGPLCKVVISVATNEKEWYIKIGKDRDNAARFFPDTLDWNQLDGRRESELYCLSCLTLSVRKTESSGERIDVQGLVLRRLRNHRYFSLPVFERVGFFTTRRVDKAAKFMSGLISADNETVRIV